MSEPRPRLPRDRFLTAAQVRQLHLKYVIAHNIPSQTGMLESGVQSPTNLRHYGGEEDVFQFAEKIMKNHAFPDGNKRTALVAADMFLKVKGYHLRKVPFEQVKFDQELANAHVAVATNQWTAEQLGHLYKTVLEYKTNATEY
ncbi:hypothetical protein BDW69DRAFT_197771 [Aspergillus filifer]